MAEETVQSAPALELAEHGLEELVAALIAGRAISTGGDCAPFRLVSEDARTLLQFYRTRPDLWIRSKPVVSKEVDDLLVAFARATKHHSEPSVPKPKLVPATWTLAKIEAHRFAGLHRHCDANGQDPDIFELVVDRDITCVWGFNGAGKTALQSAILWCLTGRAFRSLHLPDEVHELVDVRYALDGGEDDEQAPSKKLSIPPLVPLPSMNDLVALNDRLAFDTWVQLTFVDSAGRAQVVRRSLQQIGKGRPTTREQGLSSLGVSQLAIEAGTLMPAIAASMRFDEKTTFAASIAQLTGLKPLADLGRRATRVAKRLRTEEAQRASSTKIQKLNQFKSAERTLTEAWQRQEDEFGPTPPLFLPSDAMPETSSKDSIQAAVLHLDMVKTRAQADILALLGQLPPLTTSAQVSQFVQQLDEAGEALTAGALSELPSAAVSKKLVAISATDREAALGLLQELAVRASNFAERLRNVQEAARLQLYARVAEWHQQHRPHETLTDCPVCGTNLDNLPPDAILNIDVREALRRSLQADSDATKGVEQWERDAARELLEGLAESLRPFADIPPPSSLHDLYRQMYVDELLNQAPFRALLSPLNSTAAGLWVAAVGKNPLRQSDKTGRIELPQEFVRSVLGQRFENVQAVIALATQREQCAGEIRVILANYLGSFEPPRELWRPVGLS